MAPLILLLFGTAKKNSGGCFCTQRRANVEFVDIAYCYGTPIGIASLKDNGQTWVYRGTLKLDFDKGVNTFWAPDIIYNNGEYHIMKEDLPCK